MPRWSQARAIRTATSPRLAMRMRWNVGGLIWRSAGTLPWARRWVPVSRPYREPRGAGLALRERGARGLLQREARQTLRELRGREAQRMPLLRAVAVGDQKERSAGPHEAGEGRRVSGDVALFLDMQCAAVHGHVERAHE